MLRVFKGEPGLGDKLAGRRNWCEVWEASSSISARNQPLPEYQVAAQGSLVFTLRLEVCPALLHHTRQPCVDCATVGLFCTSSPQQAMHACHLEVPICLKAALCLWL